MRITIEKSIAPLEILWRHWEEQGSLHVFQTRAFVQTWLETAAAAQRREPCLALVEMDNTPAMIFPLALRQRFGMTILEFCGGLLCDYEAPVLAPRCPQPDQAAMRDIWHALVCQSGAQAAHLRQVCTDIPNVNGTSRTNPLTLLPLWNNGTACAARSNGEAGAAFLQRIRKKRLTQDSRRQLKRLGALGNLRFVTASTPEERLLFTQTMIAQKQRRYKETGVFDVFSLPGHKAFYLSLAQDNGCASQNLPHVHISALLLDNKILAVHWGFVWRHTFSYLMPSYEGGEWQRYSCGRLLLEWLMEQIFDEHCVCFDFTVGGEAYKSDWCNEEQPIYAHCHPAGVRGLAYTAVLGAKRGALRLFRKG